MNRVPRIAQLRTDIDCGRHSACLRPGGGPTWNATVSARPWRRGDTGSLHRLGFGGRRNLGFGFGLLEVLRRSGERQGRCGRPWFMDMFPGPSRHFASDVMSDLVIAVHVALAAVIASGLLDREWDAL
jgi:hypothetical protein